MLARWQWQLGRYFHLMWVRATLFSVAGVAAALVALVVKPWVPEDLALTVGADAVDKILTITASSMLAVTTFSLSAVIAAYGSASASATPRATKLLMQDSSTQNMLATFIGSFLFSVVGIIALSTGLYGAKGRVVMFFVSLLMIVLIVYTLLLWINHLIKFGRLGEVTERLEETTAKALEERRLRPYLGGQALWRKEDIPSDAFAVCSPLTGYVQLVDMLALGKLASEEGRSIYVVAPPGTFVYPGMPLAYCHGFTEDMQEQVLPWFKLGYQRSFEQDPRFGVQVLTEVASRGLSSAVNDLGTPIDIIGRGVRLFHRFACGERGNAPTEGSCIRVYVTPLQDDDLFDDFFRPIARDGASLIEIILRLVKALHMLAKLAPERYLRPAQRQARIVLAYAKHGLHLEEEIAQVQGLVDQLLEEQLPEPCG